MLCIMYNYIMVNIYYVHYICLFICILKLHCTFFNVYTLEAVDNLTVGNLEGVSCTRGKFNHINEL